ncbi:Isochorismatase family protein [Anaerohalosphaera lusitana]|uniref:Isochorismatase family protein n=1 Tax=Anaerohalosphaera lusitana TaxID=1936003 RepID=A0A1U9NJF0_9BACT|nr:isochorismatase family protein [Anaerohalosphaera lusitana]AQT68049.1 Isochorismatase family protein [Anaerohalosphaera lusitana]
MIRPVITLRRRRVLIDVDTQKDFFLADGKAPIRNHRRVLINIRRVVAWARLKNVRMISTIWTPIDTSHQFCIPGTSGHEKLSYTTRENHVSFQADGSTDLPRDIFTRCDQIILEKRSPNPFDEPRADRILSELKADEYILMGALNEEAIKKTAIGLLARRKHVTVLTDCLGYHNKDTAEIANRQMEAKGAKLAESKTLLGASPLRLVQACDCDRCRGRMTKKNDAHEKSHS